MGEEVSVQARVVPTRIVLGDPWKFQGRPLVCFETSERHLAALRKFAAENNMDDIMITFHPGKTWTERAKHFLFLVRDRLAAAAGETTREYKEHLYKQAKREAGLAKDGESISLNDMSREQVWQLTNLMLDWAEKAGVDQSDFRGHLEGLKKE